MNTQCAFDGKENLKGRKGMEFFPVAGGLLVVEVVLLALRSYVMTKILVVLAITALCVFVCAALVLLFIFVQEAGRLGLRWIRNARREIPSPKGVAARARDYFAQGNSPVDDVQTVPLECAPLKSASAGH